MRGIHCIQTLTLETRYGTHYGSAHYLRLLQERQRREDELAQRTLFKACLAHSQLNCSNWNFAAFKVPILLATVQQGTKVTRGHCKQHKWTQCDDIITNCLEDDIIKVTTSSDNASFIIWVACITLWCYFYTTLCCNDSQLKFIAKLHHAEET